VNKDYQNSRGSMWRRDPHSPSHWICTVTTSTTDRRCRRPHPKTRIERTQGV